MDPSQSTARQQLHTSHSSNTLSRISTVSDITDLDLYDDGNRSPQSPQSPPLTARASLVSLASNDSGVHHVASPRGGSGWSIPLSTNTNADGYQPVYATDGPTSGIRRGRSGFGYSGSLRRAQETIPEEESIDLSLLMGAAPMAIADAGEPLEDGGEPAFDLTTSLGPMTRQDEAFIKKLQEQEAGGKLTGGLGRGIRTDMIMSESQLLATNPPLERKMTRTFSMNVPRQRSRLGRSATVRQLGQSEANKRGEVIEVVMEDPSEVDLSVVAGPTTATMAGLDRPRTTDQAGGAPTRQVFYPQPNWKPFSMRWPYLTFLIVLSLGLAGAMEVIFQLSTRQPLLEFHSPDEIPGGQYFLFKYLPTIITVSFGVLWQITDFEVKRLEAFYQLSREGGALAAESINVDYITNFNFMRPIRALQYRHYAVAVSSVASLLAVSLVPTLGTACLVLTPDRQQRQADPLGPKSIEVQPVLSRILSITLLVVAFLGCTLFYQLQSRRTGLVGDVKGIAGLASMAVVAHILMDFKDMDLAKPREIHNRLKDHRYVLRNASLAPDDERPPSKRERDKYTGKHLSENPHPLMLRPEGCLPFIVAISLFLALIPVCLFTPATLLTDKAPWVVTAVAVCIKLGWGSLETDVRMMEPFYILSRRHAPPRTLALDYTALPFGWVVIEALLNGHFLVFFAGFGTVMTDILTVLITSLAAVEGRDFISPPPSGDDPGIDSGQETPLSFWVTLGLATSILAYLGVVATVVFVRRHHPFLPRQPNTISSILAFIHQSKMLWDFVDTARFTHAEMIQKLDGIGKTYGLGWFQGRDGQTHCGIDEEELLSNYSHGKDYSLSNQPWIETQTEWL